MRDRTYELLYQSPVSGATAGSIAMRLDALFRSRLFKCVLPLEVQGTQYPMMASLDTNELIDRAHAGDQAAYTELLKRYQPQVQAVCLKMVHNRETARDLTQETFVKAFGALGTFDRTYTFSTWLYKIARNTCIDHFRRSKLETFSLDAPIRTRDGEMDRDFPSPIHTPERYLLLKEKGRLIAEAIDSLPGKYREVIHLRHTQELPYEEIAGKLGVPLGTVKARLFRARELLKKRLKAI